MVVENSSSTRSVPRPNGRPKDGRDELFRVVAELFYRPSTSLAQLSRKLGCSISTTKRRINLLRRQGVLQGRLPSVKLDLGLLAQPPLLFCTALVAAAPDVEQLRQLGQSDDSTPYRSEKGLLDWLCYSLPQTEPYRGQIVVETGHIVLGSLEFGLVLTVHAIANDVLYRFVMSDVERAKGIARTQTMMVAYTPRHSKK